LSYIGGGIFDFGFSILDFGLGAAAPNLQWSGSSQSKIENPKSKIQKYGAG